MAFGVVLVVKQIDMIHEGLVVVVGVAAEGVVVNIVQWELTRNKKVLRIFFNK